MLAVLTPVQLYLIKPDFDEARMGRRINMERALWDDIDRPDAEEKYRKTYQSNSSALFFASCENSNETWLPLLEKAYAKAHGDYAAIEGGFTGEGIEDLTGGVTTELVTMDILNKVGIPLARSEVCPSLYDDRLADCWARNASGRSS